MPTAQVAIFAVGTSAHCYLEFTGRPGVDPTELVRAVADLEEPHTTVGGANIAVGVRPSLWAAIAPAEQVARIVRGAGEGICLAWSVAPSGSLMERLEADIDAILAALAPTGLADRAG